MFVILAGQDYTGLSTILTFTNDDTMKPVKVSIDDDTGNPKLEGIEIFEILLTMPTNGILGTQNISVIQIDDTESDSKYGNLFKISQSLKFSCFRADGSFREGQH